MSKRRREPRAANTVTKAGADSETSGAKTPAGTGWGRFPIWAWVLIFIVPLVLSEYMFYVGGRTASMVMFPIAWVGFWAVLVYRSRSRGQSGG